MGWLISIPPKTMVCWNSNPQDLKMWFYLEKQSLYPSWIMGLSWQRGLHNSMKLWAKSCRATQDRWAIVKSSNKTWFTGGGNGKSLKSSCHENHMKSMKKQQKDMTPEDDPLDQQVCRCSWGRAERELQEEWRGWTKEKKHSGVEASLGESIVRCCKEQYCVGTWNVGSMNHGKLKAIKQGMARVNIDTLGLSELK